jgi:hypothetical protein
MTDRSLGEVAKDTAADVRRLIQLEIRLAIEGVKRQIRGAAVSAATGLAGALFLTFGLLLLLVAGALGLALVVPIWAAFLIVGGGVIVLGAALAAGAAAGMKSKAAAPLPPETREQLTEDAQWLLSNEKTA